MTAATEVREICNETEVPSEAIENIKHPLEDSWCIWLYTSDNNKWGQNLVNLTTFDTVEDWWCLYHHMKLPSELQNGQDYALFKKGISPMWEDKANKNGGRWLINVERRVSELDSNWMFTVLILIGATIKYRNLVCGAVVNVRTKKSKIGVWLTGSSQEPAILSIGKDIKRALGIQSKINYHNHDVSINKYMI